MAEHEAKRREIAALLPRLRRFAYGLTGSVDEGDDLVQSACERALARLDQVEAGSRLDSWMYRIVQTVWIDRVRGRRLHLTAMDPDLLQRVVGGDCRQEIEARLTLAAVYRIVATLPEEQRAVLILVSVEGQSYKEAAATLEVPIGTVMSRLARARLTLARGMAHEQRPRPRLVKVGG